MDGDTEAQHPSVCGALAGPELRPPPASSALADPERRGRPGCLPAAELLLDPALAPSGLPAPSSPQQPPEAGSETHVERMGRRQAGAGQQRCNRPHALRAAPSDSLGTRDRGVGRRTGDGATTPRLKSLAAARWFRSTLRKSLFHRDLVFSLTNSMGVELGSWEGHPGAHNQGPPQVLCN